MAAPLLIEEKNQLVDENSYLHPNVGACEFFRGKQWSNNAFLTYPQTCARRFALLLVHWYHQNQIQAIVMCIAQLEVILKSCFSFYVLELDK